MKRIKYIKSSSTSPCSVLLAFTFSLFFRSSPSCPSSMLSFIFTYHMPLILPLSNLPFLTREFLQDSSMGFFFSLYHRLNSHLQFYVFGSIYSRICSFMCVALSLPTVIHLLSDQFFLAVFDLIFLRTLYFFFFFSFQIFLLLFFNKVVNALSKMPFVCGGLNGQFSQPDDKAPVKAAFSGLISLKQITSITSYFHSADFHTYFLFILPRLILVWTFLEHNC